jgi:hypothetical protein
MKIPKVMLLRAMVAGQFPKLLSVPLQILGFFVVPLLWRYRKVDLPSMLTYNKWATLWVNPEDWTAGWRGHPPEYECLPKNFREDGWKGFWGFYRYHALRNRAHGLRNYSWWSVKLKEGEIEYLTPKKLHSYGDWWIWKRENPKAGDKYWYFAWQGRKIGFKCIRYFEFRGKLRYYQCKFGWRIGPYDAHGRIESSHRWQRGTTATFQPIQIGVAGSDYD